MHLQGTMKDQNKFLRMEIPYLLDVHIQKFFSRYKWLAVNGYWKSVVFIADQKRTFLSFVASLNVNIGSLGILYKEFYFLKSRVIYPSQIIRHRNGRFRRFHGSSIPVNRPTDRNYSVPLETDKNLLKRTSGYDYRISTFNSWHFPPGLDRKQWVFCKILLEIHGILL